MKEIEKNIFELEKNLTRLKKYYDYDDIESKRISDVKNLFNQSTDEGYYKPIRTINDFGNKKNCIELKEIGTKFYQS